MTIIKKVFQLLLFIVIFGFYQCNGLKSNDIRHHLGTRTPYRIKCNKDDSKIKFPSKYPLFLFAKIFKIYNIINTFKPFRLQSS